MRPLRDNRFHYPGWNLKSIRSSYKSVQPAVIIKRLKVYKIKDMPENLLSNLKVKSKSNGLGQANHWTKRNPRALPLVSFSQSSLQTLHSSRRMHLRIITFWLVLQIILAKKVCNRLIVRAQRFNKITREANQSLAQFKTLELCRKWEKLIQLP